MTEYRYLYILRRVLILLVLLLGAAAYFVSGWWRLVPLIVILLLFRLIYFVNIPIAIDKKYSIDSNYIYFE